MDSDIMTRRSEQRDRLQGGVLYSFNGGDSLDAHTALLSNISGSGACIYTQSPIPIGESISIYSRVLKHREPRDAKVMWCNRISDDLYMVGLQFSSSS